MNHAKLTEAPSMNPVLRADRIRTEKLDHVVVNLRLLGDCWSNQLR